MLGDAALAAKMAEELLTEGIYVIGFSYPLCPWARLVFVHKCLQHIRVRTWILR